MTAPYDTLLVLSGMGVTPYSTRQAKQLLAPIEASANIRRTVNGTLINLSPSQFTKYKSTISCEDQESPATDGIFPGTEIVIDCISELAYLTGGSPERPVVEGSERTVGPWTFYRPRLAMMMTAPLEVTTAEWGATVAWQMELEEV